MAFRCPSCRRPKLEITKTVELHPDDESDEITVQALKCSAWTCRFVGIAVYEESRRGSLSSESFRHAGYALPGKEFTKAFARAALMIKRKEWAALATLAGPAFPMQVCD